MIFFSKICLYDFSQIGLDISVELGFTHYVCGKLFCNIRSKCLRFSNFDSPSKCLVLLSTRILYSVSVYFGLADVSMWCINLRMKNEQHVLGNKNEYEIQCLGWN